MPGSVRFDGTELSCAYYYRRSFEQLLSALLAKLGAESVCPAAIWAADLKPRATVLAEYGVLRILGLALKAVHGVAKLDPES